jgi:hypothetical protein
MRRARAAFLAAVVGGAAALGLAACGNDDDDPTSPTSPTGSEQPLPSDDGRGKEANPGTGPA